MTDWVLVSVILVAGGIATAALSVVGLIIWSDAKAERLKEEAQRAIHETLRRHEAHVLRLTDEQAELLRRHALEAQRRDTVDVANEWLSEKEVK